jgi:triacylglycerol lipase
MILEGRKPMQSYFSNSKLLKTPGKRAAYSDRTAYMMAEMSRLAYFRFEGGRNITEILESLKKLISSKADLVEIETILKSSLVP